MYQLLCNLSLVDICYTTTTIPKLLNMLLTGRSSVTFTQCFTQMYFYWMAGATGDLVLVTMAYDRYVAICDPLHYHRVFSKKNMIRLITSMWTAGSLNSLCVTIAASYMSFCHSAVVPQFYCDARGLVKISCNITEAFYVVICIELFLFGLCPLFCSLFSYIKVFGVILKMRSKERSKAFSTCSSHISVLLIYYGTSLPMYFRPPTDQSDVLDKIFSVVYTAVTPMLNPLIYSFRNKEVKKALLGLAHQKYKK
ncbi:olfactory receptor 1A1-like [Gastrophryne carolinensis]